MTTTTVRLEAALKARIEAAARRAGKTPHAFILEAISQTVDRVEYEHELHRLADERWATLVATGKTVSLDAATAYVRARGRGERPRKPRARKLGRRVT
jgi:predicted transcriptional regulator